MRPVDRELVVVVVALAAASRSQLRLKQVKEHMTFI